MRALTKRTIQTTELDLHIEYKGNRTPQGLQIMRETEGRAARPLDPRLDLRNHSPTGLEVGYLGSGPAQTALALLADVTDEHTALHLYQRFKREVVQRLPREGFTLTETEILRWLELRKHEVPQPDVDGWDLREEG